MKNKKKRIKGLLITIPIILAGVYLVAMIISAVLLTKITTIHYESTAFGITLLEYKVDFRSHKAERIFYDYDGTLNDQCVEEVSLAQEQKIKMAYVVALGPLWRKFYDNPNICDGDQWHMTRTYDDGSEVITYGSNAYPLGYPLVLDEIRGLFRAQKIKAESSQNQQKDKVEEKQETDTTDYADDARDLVATIEATHPCFVLDQIPAQYEEERRKYITAVTMGETAKTITLSEFELLTRKYLSVFEDAHTAVSGQANELFLGIEGCVTEDTFYLKDEVGTVTDDKVQSIGGIKVADILKVAQSYAPSENETAKAYNGAQWSLYKEVLKAAGCDVSGESMTVEILHNGSTEQREVPFVEKNIYAAYQYDEEMASKQIDDIYYLDINTFMMEEDTLETEISKLEEAIKAGTHKVIIDVRDNGGGMADNGRKLLECMGMSYPTYGAYFRFSPLTKEQRGTKESDGYVRACGPSNYDAKKNEALDLVVLVDEHTFSAATMFAVMVQDGQLGTVIGQPSINAPSCYSDVVNYTTKNTQLNISIATSKLDRPDQKADQKTLQPDIPVPSDEDTLQVAIHYLNTLQ